MDRYLAGGRRDAFTRNVQSGAQNQFRSQECGPLRTFQLEQLQWWGQRRDRGSDGVGREALSRFPPRLGILRCQSISETRSTLTAPRLGTPRAKGCRRGASSREEGRTRWSTRRRRSVRGGRPARVGRRSRSSTRQARCGRNPAPTRPPPSASKSPRNQHALAAESAKPTRQPVERFGSSNSMSTWTFIAWPDDMIYIGRCRAAGRNGRATRNVQSGA